MIESTFREAAPPYVSHPKPRTPALNHVPALDGVRGIAILLVIAAHNFGLRGGVYGVDLFFVLSGFLITRILLATAQSEHYFSTFYTRRALRIFPVYYVTLAVMVCWKADVRANWWSFAFYLHDLIGFGVGGWARRFSHTWSLSMEEQFYLIWPFLVRRLSRRALLTICVLGIAVNVASRIATSFGLLGSIDLAYPYSPLHRSDGLFIGSALAILWAGSVGVSGQRRRAAMIAFAGGLAIAAALAATHQLSFSRATLPMSLFGVPSIAIASAGLIALALDADETAPLARLLSWPPLRRLGRISYGLYLFHNIIIIEVLERRPDFEQWPIARRLTVGFIAAAIAYLIAELSWRFLESPISRLKDRVAPNVADNARSR